MWMAVSRGPCEVNEYRQCSAVERLRLLQAVRGLPQLGQVVEIGGYHRMIGSVARLVDRQRAPQQRLRLRQAVRDTQQPSQVIEPDSDTRMIRTVARLIDPQRAPHQ